jgi:hypothetical protein
LDKPKREMCLINEDKGKKTKNGIKEIITYLPNKIITYEGDTTPPKKSNTSLN